MKSFNQPDPLVSIIIPTFNYDHFITNTLNCLQEQHYNNWEAIIIDDGSTDSTKEIIKNYLEIDKRFYYIYQENKGLSMARNAGLKYSKGQYLSFLDADDLLSNDKIKIQVAYMENHKNCDISYTNSKYFADGKSELLFNNYNLNQIEWMPKVSGSYWHILPSLFAGNIMPVNSPLIRSEFYNKHLLTFNQELKCLEDWDFWLRCAFIGGNFQYIENDKALSLIRIHPLSMSQNKPKMDTFEFDLRELISLYIKKYPVENNKKLEQINNRELNIFYRGKIRQQGFFRLKSLATIANRIGWLKTIKLYFKELNSYRKGK